MNRPVREPGVRGTNSVSVGVTRLRAVYGSSVKVFGSIPSGATGETVTLHISTYGMAPITKDVVTDGGVYEFSYRLKAKTGVRPLLVFRALNRSQNLFFVRVKAAKSYAHKLVRIQRQNSPGVWVTTKIVRLNVRSQRTFRGRFPRGTTKAQAWTSKTPGYVAGFSVIKLISR